MRKHLSLLHTNDMHGHLQQVQARRLADLKRELAPALLLDAGDAVSSGNLDFRPWGERSLRLMNAAGYDAMAIGNRESHPWRLGLRLKTRDAAFPVLCANLRPRRGTDTAGIQPAVVLEVPGGGRVGVFGLLVEMFTEQMWSAPLCELVFVDPIATARQRVPSLRESCDWVLCLSHLGLERDLALAEAVPEIDAIIGAHSHTPIETPRLAGRAWVVQSKPYARAVGRLSLMRAGNEVQAEGELLPL